MPRIISEILRQCRDANLPASMRGRRRGYGSSRLRRAASRMMARLRSWCWPADSALIRQCDRLDGEGTRVFSLVGAEQERRLAFRDPAGVADHRHGNGLDETILNGLDLRRVVLDRDLVQSAG